MIVGFRVATMPPYFVLEDDLFTCSISSTRPADPKVELVEELTFFADQTLWCYLELNAAAMLGSNERG